MQTLKNILILSAACSLCLASLFLCSKPQTNDSDFAEETPTATPDPSPQSFDPAICDTGQAYPANGANTALYTTCQYIRIKDLTANQVATLANSKDDPQVQRLLKSGFQLVGDDYNPLISEEDVCIEYRKDKSVSCFKLQ